MADTGRRLANASHSSGIHDWFFFGFMLLAVVLRFNKYGDDLFVDDAFNWWVSKDGVFAAVERIQADFFPPLYSVLLAFWLKIAPDTEFMLRLPGRIIGLLSVYGVYRFFLKTEGKSFGRMMFALLALSPAHVLWSQYLKPYGLSSGLVLLAAALLACLLERSRRPAADERANKPMLLALGLVLTAAVYTDHIMTVWVFAGFVIAAAIMRRNTGIWLSPLVKQLLIVNLLVFILWLPSGALIIEQRAAADQILYPSHQPDLFLILNTLTAFAGPTNMWFMPALSYVLVPFLLLGVLVRWQQGTPQGLLFIGLSIGLPALLLALFFIDPMFGHMIRRSVWLIPFFLYFTATGLIVAIRTLAAPVGQSKAMPFASMMVMSTVLVLFGKSNWNEYALRNRGWFNAGQAVGAKAESCDKILPGASLNRALIEYYFPPAVVQQAAVLPDHMSHWHRDSFMAFFQGPDFDRLVGRASNLWVLNVPPERVDWIVAQGYRLEKKLSGGEREIVAYKFTPISFQSQPAPLCKAISGLAR